MLGCSQEVNLGEYILLQNVSKNSLNLTTFELRNTTTQENVTFPSVWVAPGNRVVVAYGSGEVTEKLQFMAINAFPAAKLDDDNIYWHWQTELTLPDDESVLKLFEIQSDSTLSLRDEVKYGITYGRDASNLSTDSLLHVLQRDAYEVYRAHFDLPEFSVGVRGASWEEWENIPYIDGGSLWREVDLKRYELKDHLGNVRVIVSDLRRAKLVAGVPTDFTALIKHYSNYYPFGMEKPSMVWDKGGYRYGFNGKENDDELKGVGNHQDYGMRVYDPRLAKFLSVDPLSPDYPELTPFQFASNTPIQAIDLDGLEAFFVHGTQSNNTRWLKNSQNSKNLNDGASTLFKLTNNKSYDATFNWSGNILNWGNGIFNTVNDRRDAAENLADHVMGTFNGKEDITLIGHSHGGNVAIQAIPIIEKKTKRKRLFWN